MFKKKIWHVENRVSILKMASDYQRKQNKHTQIHHLAGRMQAFVVCDIFYIFDIVFIALAKFRKSYAHKNTTTQRAHSALG